MPAGGFDSRRTSKNIFCREGNTSVTLSPMVDCRAGAMGDAKNLDR
jgi:hypothetical protein